MTSSGEILNGGFRLLGRRPGAVAIWGLLHASLTLLSLVFVLPRMMGAMHAMLQAQAQGDANPNMVPQVAIQSMAGVQAFSWLLSIGGTFLGAVLMCAAFRAVLRPEDGGFASLKVGMDEVRIFAMTWVVSIGGGICFGILALILLLLSFLFSFLLGNTPAVVAIVIAVLWLAAIGAAIYAVVRLSMLFPLTFIRREFVFDEAWKVTRGRFWTLFLPYLVIFAIVAVLWSLIFIPVGWSIIANLPPPPSGADPQAAQAYVAALMGRWAGQPFGVLGAILMVGALVQAISTALYAGAMATAAHGFLADDGRLPEIFE